MQCIFCALPWAVSREFVCELFSIVSDNTEDCAVDLGFSCDFYGFGCSVDITPYRQLCVSDMAVTQVRLRYEVAGAWDRWAVTMGQLTVDCMSSSFFWSHVLTVPSVYWLFHTIQQLSLLTANDTEIIAGQWQQLHRGLYWREEWRLGHFTSARQILSHVIGYSTFLWQPNADYIPHWHYYSRRQWIPSSLRNTNAG